MEYYDLFSGIGGFSKAIHDVFPHAQCLGFSEIDQGKSELFLKRFPGSTALGDVRSVQLKNLKKHPTLVTLGSPCQDLSKQRGKNRQGLKGSKSSLFFDGVNFLKAVKPKYFIMENVANMKDEDMEIISEHLGCYPIIINSALVSSQNRDRYYWTNIPNVDQPEDRNIVLKRGEVLVHSWSKSYRPANHSATIKQVHFDERIRHDGKANTIIASASAGESLNFFPPEPFDLLLEPAMKRKVYKRSDLFVHKIKPEWYLTAEECEEAQTFPIGWTEGYPEKTRKKWLGDAVTVEVIKHILSFIPSDYK